jgi:hypothetical protein
MDTKVKNKATRKIDKWIRIGFLIGSPLLLVGLLWLILLPSSTAINLKTLLPKVSNGSILIVLGFRIFDWKPCEYKE